MYFFLYILIYCLLVRWVNINTILFLDTTLWITKDYDGADISTMPVHPRECIGISSIIS